MPKVIDDQVRARAVRLVAEHQQEYLNLTAACQAVARQVGVARSQCVGGAVRLRSIPVSDLA